MSWIRHSRHCVAPTAVTQSTQSEAPGAAQVATDSGSRRASDFKSATFTSYHQSAHRYVDKWVAFSERMGLWQD